MRILMSIHHQLDTNAGAPGVTLHLANALRRRGHAVDILSFDRMPFPARLKGLLYPWFVTSFIAKQPWHDVLDLSSGDGWVLSTLPRAWLGTPAPVLIARSHGLEHVMHEARLEATRSSGQKLSWKYPIYHGGFRLWECRMSFLHADAALFLNDGHLQYAIERLGVHPDRAVRVRNGIADCFIERARSLMTHTLPIYSPSNIAFIGRHSDMKGSRYLCRAMRAILAASPRSTFGVFGAMVDPNVVLAEYPPELRSRIFVVPSYRNEDLPRLLHGYHVLAFPSLSEGFATSPLEGMACGLVPVVAAAPGPMTYIENGRNGVVVPLRDADALEREIGSLLKDARRWHDLRSRALETAIEYTWDNVASDTEKIYEQFGHAADGENCGRARTRALRD